MLVLNKQTNKRYIYIYITLYQLRETSFLESKTNPKKVVRPGLTKCKHSPNNVWRGVPEENL